jgi:hypothetical protein
MFKLTIKTSDAENTPLEIIIENGGERVSEVTKNKPRHASPVLTGISRKPHCNGSFTIKPDRAEL